MSSSHHCRATAEDHRISHVQNKVLEDYILVLLVPNASAATYHSLVGRLNLVVRARSKSASSQSKHILHRFSLQNYLTTEATAAGSEQQYKRLRCIPPKNLDGPSCGRRWEGRTVEGNVHKVYR